jgi:MFS family permease
MAVGVFFFIQGLCFASWASRIPTVQSQLDLSDAELGGVLLALPVGLMVSLPLSGWLVSRFGSRRMVILSALLYAMNLPVIGLARMPWQLVGILFVFGLWANLFNIAVNTQAVGAESLFGRSIMSSFHGVWSLAGFTGAAIGAFCVSANVSPLIQWSLIGALACVLVLVAYRWTVPRDADAGGEGPRPLFVRPDRTLLMLGLIAFCGMVCEGTMFDWSGVYFQKVVQVPKELTTLGYVAFMSTMAGGRFMGDRLAARLGVRRVIQLNGVLIALGLMTAVLFPSLLTATLGFMLVGIGVSTIVPLVYGAAGRSTTLSAGMALAAVSSISFLGFLLGPPMIGFIAEAASLRVSFTVSALLGLCATLLMSRVKLAK